MRQAITAFLKDMGLTADDLKKNPALAKAILSYHTVLGAAAGEHLSVLCICVPPALAPLAPGSVQVCLSNWPLGILTDLHSLPNIATSLSQITTCMQQGGFQQHQSYTSLIAR
jgi:hypothetical protein